MSQSKQTNGQPWPLGSGWKAAAAAAAGVGVIAVVAARTLSNRSRPSPPAALSSGTMIKDAAQEDASPVTRAPPLAATALNEEDRVAMLAAPLKSLLRHQVVLLIGLPLADKVHSQRVWQLH
jgi:anti-sigma-K factor RskA